MAAITQASDWENAKCEVCGAQAVVQVFDLLERENHRTGVMQIQHFGSPHLFCEEHKRDSLRFKMGPIY